MRKIIFSLFILLVSVTSIEASNWKLTSEMFVYINRLNFEIVDFTKGIIKKEITLITELTENGNHYRKSKLLRDELLVIFRKYGYQKNKILKSTSPQDSSINVEVIILKL